MGLVPVRSLEEPGSIVESKPEHNLLGKGLHIHLSEREKMIKESVEW